MTRVIAAHQSALHSNPAHIWAALLTQAHANRTHVQASLLTTALFLKVLFREILLTEAFSTPTHQHHDVAGSAARAGHTCCEPGSPHLLWAWQSTHAHSRRHPNHPSIDIYRGPRIHLGAPIYQRILCREACTTGNTIRLLSATTSPTRWLVHLQSAMQDGCGAPAQRHARCKALALEDAQPLAGTPAECHARCKVLRETLHWIVAPHERLNRKKGSFP
mmetsp:Transcript_31162/g.92930  ORF Transcript_31162/g.92930 Transcript_31162/m.92930 type:complete len:219 (+) Transcript_31162:364-1020(+)